MPAAGRERTDRPEFCICPRCGWTGQRRPWECCQGCGYSRGAVSEYRLPRVAEIAAGRDSYGYDSADMSKFVPALMKALGVLPPEAKTDAEEFKQLVARIVPGAVPLPPELWVRLEALYWKAGGPGQDGTIGPADWRRLEAVYNAVKDMLEVSKEIGC